MSTFSSRVRAVSAAVVWVFCCAGCDGGQAEISVSESGESTPASTNTATADTSGDRIGKLVTLKVFAASSLTDAFLAIEQGFETLHPGVDISLNIAGSQALRLQLEQGAEADVFASANEHHMKALVDAGLIADTQVFAHNELVVIVPPENPAQISDFSELVDAERVVVGADTVPVGMYTERMFEKTRAQIGEPFSVAVRDNIVSEESNVRLVRTKVELAEADAAVVYRTDAASSDNVRRVSIPQNVNVRADYPIGVLAAATHAKLAATFIDFVTSKEGQALLADQGFVAETL